MSIKYCSNEKFDKLFQKAERELKRSEKEMDTLIQKVDREINNAFTGDLLHEMDRFFEDEQS